MSVLAPGGWRIRSTAAFVAALLAASGSVATVSAAQGGWGTTGTFAGIYGYLRQSGTTHVSVGVHAVWINLCDTSSCAQFVQTGTYQGYAQFNQSPDAVHMYYENFDMCGDYYASDLGVPPSPDIPYYINVNGGPSRYTCSNGNTFGAYPYAYRKVSYSSMPFFTGLMSVGAGPAISHTEVKSGAPIGTDRFGCDPNLGCTNGSYGLHLFDGTAWHDWDTNDPSVLDPGDPPYTHTVNDYWSFYTCPTSC